jgi:hypothetical protein
MIFFQQICFERPRTDAVQNVLVQACGDTGRGMSGVATVMLCWVFFTACHVMCILLHCCAELLLMQRQGCLEQAIGCAMHLICHLLLQVVMKRGAEKLAGIL